MKPEDRDYQDVKRTLQEVFPPIGEAAELRRDLWPAMLRRVHERQSRIVPWYDWALAAALVTLAALFPRIALLFAFHL